MDSDDMVVTILGGIFLVGLFASISLMAIFGGGC